MIETHFVRFPDRLNSRSGWWAVYTRHQHEKAVANMLVAKGLETFLPLYESVRHWKGRRKRLLMPLFPGYLFVRENLGGPLQILAIPGINMILSRGNDLEVISDDEIQTIWRASVDPSNIEPHPFLNSGERVRITSGPMQGIEGILVRKKNLSRLVVSVEMLAQSVSIEVDTRNVEPVRPSSVRCLLCHEQSTVALYQSATSAVGGNNCGQLGV
ncbi:MAG: UpxY family transcription antiterminator [Terracidiphilus sp.]|nr:UpxY family transcription antiterminator [Terracidiphilus sp.]